MDQKISSVLAEFGLEREGIVCLMEERHGMNKHIVKGKKRKEWFEHNTYSCYKN